MFFQWNWILSASVAILSCHPGLSERGQRLPRRMERHTGLGQPSLGYFLLASMLRLGQAAIRPNRIVFVP